MAGEDQMPEAHARDERRIVEVRFWKLRGHQRVEHVIDVELAPIAGDAVHAVDIRLTRAATEEWRNQNDILAGGQNLLAHRNAVAFEELLGARDKVAVQIEEDIDKALARV